MWKTFTGDKKYTVPLERPQYAIGYCYKGKVPPGLVQWLGMVVVLGPSVISKAQREANLKP